VKKSIIVIAGVLLSVMMESATDVPKYEVFLGYTYVRQTNSARTMELASQ
jgi:hypothetical protein